MTHRSANQLREIASDLKTELDQLDALRTEIETTQRLSWEQPNLNQVFTESLGLKLHNFYTVCERIFKIIASELNGGLPSSYNWHQRLLTRMATTQTDRPAVISQATAKQLKEYLSFRHIVRNIYGFELEASRVTELVNDYYSVWDNFTQEIKDFIKWLEDLSLEVNE